MNNLIKSLERVLADSYALYLKTQNYHWNVEGRNFLSLHSLFEEQYNDLAKSIDEAAELIRGLSAKAPGTFDAYIKLTRIKNGESSKDTDMLQDLFNDQTTITETLNQALEAAQNVKDEVVIAFITDRLTTHRKNAWMLKSLLA